MRPIHLLITLVLTGCAATKERALPIYGEEPVVAEYHPDSGNVTFHGNPDDAVRALIKQIAGLEQRMQALTPKPQDKTPEKKKPAAKK